MRGVARICMLFLVLGFLLPGASFAQSAGDDQYTDPFAEPEGGGQGGGGQGGGGGQTGGGETTQPDTGAAPETGGTTDPPPETGGTTEPSPSEAGGGFGASASSAPSSGSDVLPRTGLPVALAAGLGAVLLAGGVALRRRV